MSFKTFIETFWPLLWIGTTIGACLILAWIWPWPPQAPKDER